MYGLESVGSGRADGGQAEVVGSLFPLLVPEEFFEVLDMWTQSADVGLEGAIFEGVDNRFTREVCTWSGVRIGA